jgi:hypothetical protein
MTQRSFWSRPLTGWRAGHLRGRDVVVLAARDVCVLILATVVLIAALEVISLPH